MGFPADSNKQSLLRVKLCAIAEQFFFVGFYGNRPSFLTQHNSSSFSVRF